MTPEFLVDIANSKLKPRINNLKIREKVLNADKLGDLLVDLEC